MANTITVKELSERLVVLARAAAPPDAVIVRDEYDHEISVSCRRGWTIEARLRVDFRNQRDCEAEIEPRVSLSWPTTGFVVCQAIAAIALYRQMAELAALLESVASEATIVRGGA